MSKFCTLVIALLMIVRFTYADDFLPVLEPVPLQFPRDHGAHPDQAIEWWYFTGHLKTDAGKQFGFELTFFRVGISRKPLSPSAWETGSIYLADFAVTDDGEQQFHFAEKRGRESFGGAGAMPDALDVHIGSWSAKQQCDAIEIQADDSEKSLKLTLSPLKPPVLHGDRGFSKKGPLPGQASIYSGITRLAGNGTLRIGQRQETITDVSAWMDHEAFTSVEQSDVKGAHGWDWFGIQLHSGEELMLYQLRDKHGAATDFSAGSFIDRTGAVTALMRKDFEIKVLNYWQSRKSGKRYPSEWALTIPKLSLSLHITPTVADQEILSATGVPYWEGRSIVRDQGAAYVELVGY